MTRIKRCPFCGEKAKWVKQSTNVMDEGLIIYGYRLECSACWCSPFPNNYWGDMNKAIEVWNDRINKNENIDDYE